jgi:hypothetical protein
MKTDSSGAPIVSSTDPASKNPADELGVRYPGPGVAKPDIKQDGNVSADNHEGMSANTDPYGMPPHRRPEAFDGTQDKKAPASMFGIDEDDLKKQGLQFEPDPDDTHGVIKPIKDMTPEEYDAALAATKPDWKPVSPKDVKGEDEEEGGKEC